MIKQLLPINILAQAKLKYKSLNMWQDFKRLQGWKDDSWEGLEWGGPNFFNTCLQGQESKWLPDNKIVLLTMVVPNRCDSGINQRLKREALNLTNTTELL